MRRFPVDVPRSQAIKTLEKLGFRVIREGNHISMIREKSRWKSDPTDYAESSSHQRFNFTPHL